MATVGPSPMWTASRAPLAYPAISARVYPPGFCPVAVGHDVRASGVAEGRAGPRGDGAVLFEDRGEFGEGLEGGVLPGDLVGIEDDGPFFPVLYFHRHDLGGEAPFLNCGHGLSVAAKGIFVLLFPGDGVLLVEDFRRGTHEHSRQGTVEAVFVKAVLGRFSPCGSPTWLPEQVGHIRGALHAAAGHGFHVAETDLVRREHGGLQVGPAPLVHGERGDRLGKARTEQGDPAGWRRRLPAIRCP